MESINKQFDLQKLQTENAFLKDSILDIQSKIKFMQSANNNKGQSNPVDKLLIY